MMPTSPAFEKIRIQQTEQNNQATTLLFVTKASSFLRRISRNPLQRDIPTNHENGGERKEDSIYLIGGEGAPVSPASLSLRLMNLLPPPASTASHTPIAVTATTSDASTCHQRSFIIYLDPPRQSVEWRGRSRIIRGAEPRTATQQQAPRQAATSGEARNCCAGGACCAGLF
jgi:hypothetical protein